MNLEKSCGAVVYTKIDGEYLFIIVQEQSGAYSFPKGHMEGNETEIETARREIFEETGLLPLFIDGFREMDAYDMREKPGTRKQVIYFLAECKDAAFIPQHGEIRKIVLLPYDKAKECFEYEGSRRILTSAYHYLTHI